MICWLLFNIHLTGIASSQDPGERLKIATCQFPVSRDVQKNTDFIKKYIKEAAYNKADIIHFCEASLTGYPPKFNPPYDSYDWSTLSRLTSEIIDLAKKFNIWVVLGSAHYIDKNEKPTNCLYIISNKGEIVDRYDKSFLTGNDLKKYTPGNHFTTITINGFKCGFLICYDSCFPEMYNVYRHMGVKIVFHSFYNVYTKDKRTILNDLIPAEIRVRASDNAMWVVANNSSMRYSSWPACIARPDGSMESLKIGKPGILYREFPDGEVTKEYRSWFHNNKMMVMPEEEIYHNGIPSTHPRALDTKSLPYLSKE